MIELKDFVIQVLTEITRGTAEAQEQLAGLGATVNNNHRLSPDQRVTDVRFDVSVSTAEEKTGGGRAGVFVGKSGIGGEKGSTVQDSSVGRIQFSIMLHLPDGDPKKGERGQTVTSLASLPSR